MKDYINFSCKISVQEKDMPKGNGKIDLTITLATGYEIDASEEGWEEHLVKALIGEMLVSPVKEGESNLDDGLRLLFNEGDRISVTYGLSYSRIIFSVIEKLETLRKLEGGDAIFKTLLDT